MTTDYDVIVVGAGPAGLGQVDNYPGFNDGISGPELAEKLRAHAERFGAEIRAEEVTDLRASGRIKQVLTASGRYEAPIAIVASGATHRKLGVPGERELAGKGVSYCATCDGMFFRDRRLVVVGGGDAAMTESVFLTRFAAHVTLIHRRQGFRAQAVNVEEARKNEKIEFLLDSIVTEILGQQKVEGVRVKNVKTGETQELPCDGVFVCIGHEPNTAFLKGILPSFAGSTIPTDMNMETDVKGLYAVGDVRKGSVRQVATAVADGVVAAMHAEKRIKTLAAG